MAIKSVTLTLNGQTYNLELDSATKKYKKSISAPAKTSWGQTNHVYEMQLKITDAAGNVTVVDKNHTDYGTKMKLRVKEKVKPTITVTSPGYGAYLTNSEVIFSIDVKDADSGIASNTIAAKLDGTPIPLTKTAITGGYHCTYTDTLEDGKHTLVVNVSDNDGNAATEKTVAFTVDTVPPTLNVSEPVANLITNKQICAVVGKTNDATSGLASVKIKLNGSDQGNITVAADGTFNKAVSLINGNNMIVITATDKAGKISSVTRNVTYDPDAPVIVSLDVLPNPVDAGAVFTITVEATD